MNDLCLVALAIAAVPLITTLAEIFTLRKELRRTWKEVTTCELSIAHDHQRIQLQFAQMQKEIDQLQREIATAGLESGMYVEQTDPVTRQKSYSRADLDNPSSWQAVLNEKPVEDILEEMMEATGKVG